MTSNDLATNRARNAARNPEELKIRFIKKQNWPHFVDVKQWYQANDNELQYVNYYYDYVNDTYYAHVNADMYRNGMRIPNHGEAVQLIDPVDRLMPGYKEKIKYGVVSDIIRISADYKTAKVKINFP